MKKRRLASLALLAPLLFLTACGETASLNLSANWYANTARTEQISGTYEALEYDVTFDAQQGDYSVAYETGSYKTMLDIATNYPVGDKTMDVYHYRTEYAIKGQFSYKGTPGAQFEDTAEAEVWFLNVREGLRPLKSVKTVHYNVPVGNPSANNLSTDYRYSYTIDYDDALRTALYTFTDLAEASEPTEQTIKLSGSGTYLDNEQIFFALRGLDMSATVSFRSIDPQVQRTVKLSFGETPYTANEAVSFERTFVGGETELLNGKIDTVHVSLKYSTEQPGATRTLVYAKQTSLAENNLYRNVLLKIENPIQSLGTMVYTLKKATFNNI